MVRNYNYTIFIPKLGKFSAKSRFRSIFYTKHITCFASCRRPPKFAFTKSKAMKHFIEFFEEVTLRKWRRPALSDYKGMDYSYSDVACEIEKLHLAFENAGIAKGERIAICGRNSAHWAMAFLAASTYEAVAVPLLYDFTPESVLRLTAHSESVILFTDSNVLNKIDPASAPGLMMVISLDDFSCLWARDPEYGVAVESASAEFQGLHPEGLDPSGFHYNHGSLDDLAVINYTSGTTGDPKGVMLTARSISANVLYGITNVYVNDEDSSLSMLPMAHMFGLTFEFLYTFCGGSHVYFLGKAPSPSTLLAAFAEVRPYILVTVPLVMEKIVNSKVMPVFNKPAIKILSAIPGIGNIIYAKARRKLMGAFGGKVRIIPMGGAALNPAVEKMLRKMKVPYTVGYGMTECGPLVAYQDWKAFKRSSCGKQLDGFNHVRVDSPDPARIAGEIQVQGDNVMVGYYKNESATEAAFTEDGWLRTGDLGIIRKDGSIYLKGRSKCMILSANGQNIYPEEIESIINSQPEIDESLVVSRGGRLVALVTLIQGAGETLAPAFREKINRMLPSYSQIAGFEVQTVPFVHTPKHSIKRSLYTELD